MVRKIWYILPPNKESNLLPENDLEETRMMGSEQSMSQEGCSWCFKLEWIKLRRVRWAGRVAHLGMM
jgi:hypothetical protein